VLVLDASAAVAVLLNLGPAATNIRLRVSLPGETLHVPHLFDLEVLHVLRRHSLAGNLSEDRVRLALSRLEAMRFSRYAHTTFLRRIWDLKDNLTAYDAMYIALAEALDLPILTDDAKFAKAAGHRARILHYPQE
jgi:predicted nucleic acid-binding protein